MRYAILSDVHANLEALNRVIDDALSNGVEKFICLGDVVGYGPMPQETISRLRRISAEVVAGNHDDAVSGRMPAEDFIDIAGEAVERHRSAISSADLQWLKSLAYTVRTDDFLAVHGEVSSPEEFLYIENESDAARTFSSTDAQLVFVGHTHLPGIFLTGNSGAVYKIDPVDFAVEEGKRYIVNPGSVGYPRENGGVCRSSYVIYDADLKSVLFRFLPFSVSSVMQRGTGTRKIGRLLAVGAATIALLAGAISYFAASARRSPADDKSLVLESMTAPVDGMMESFKVNLKLARDSVPVRLRYRFLQEDGTVVGGEEIEVKKSSTRSIRIARGTKNVELKVLRRNPGEEPRVESFLPSFRPHEH